MENEIKSQKPLKQAEQTPQAEQIHQTYQSQDFQALIAGFFPNAKHFDSRFDLLQVQIDESRRNQEQIKEMFGKLFGLF